MSFFCPILNKLQKVKEEIILFETSEEYLTVNELSLKIKFSRQTIYNMISRKEFVLNEHYLKPRPKKVLFKWSAVKAWMEKTGESPSNGTETTRIERSTPNILESLIKI